MMAAYTHGSPLSSCFDERLQTKLGIKVWVWVLFLWKARPRKSVTKSHKQTWNDRDQLEKTSDVRNGSGASK